MLLKEIAKLVKTPVWISDGCSTETEGNRIFWQM